MEVLKNIVEQKKRHVTEFKKESKKSWIPLREVEEIEKRRRLEITEEEKRKRAEQERLRLSKLDEYLKDKNTKPVLDSVRAQKDANLKESQEGETSALDKDSKEEVKPLADDPPPLPKEEVIKRLRRRGHVITYFGETDRERYNRLYQLEIAEHEDDFMEGQKNVFLQLLGEEDKATSRQPGFSKKSDCHSDDDNEVDVARDPRCISVNYNATEAQIQTEASGTESIDGATGTHNKGSRYENKESRIIAWIHKMLQLWSHELDERSEEEKCSNVGKVATAQYRQTGKDLKPLLKKLKSRTMDADILEKIYDMVISCEAKDYKRTHDKYIELSIGNAAWPMGVTMVGIHERAGRSKIFTSEIAHILNDETTRKYIHMLKRLISFAQRCFPSSPSTMVSLSSTHI